MKIPFSLLFAIVLSLDAFAAPVPNANVGDEFALEVRKAKVAAKKAPVKAKAPAIKAKPPPKKVAPPAAAPKPVAKKPAVAPKPVAKKPAVAPKPVAKKPAVAPKPVAKKPAAAAKPVAKKPAAKPVTKKPATAPTKKPAAKAPVAKPPAKAAPPATKPSAKPVASAKATPAAKVPASCAVRKKPAGKARADAEDLTTRATKPITACGVNIRASNVATLCKQQTVTFTFVNDELVKTKLTRRAKNDDDEDFVPDDEPAGSPECDHVLELQVLKKTLESSGGVCDTMNAMIASPNSGLTADDKADFMADIKAAINGKSNLFFLDDKLNQVKRDEVTASLKGQAPKPSLQTDLSKQRIAVNDYLTDASVNGPSTKLATKLDTLIETMLTKVETEALANIKKCGGTAADEAQVKAAKAKLKTPPTITSAWNGVLSHVAAQAKI